MKLNFCTECESPVYHRTLCLWCTMTRESEPERGDEGCSPGQFRTLSAFWFLRPPRYTVRWGYCFQESADFADFSRALQVYDARRNAPYGAELVGEGEDADCDDDGYYMCSDGLTEAEREAIDALG